jgi:hypothetical protein
MASKSVALIESPFKKLVIHRHPFKKCALTGVFKKSGTLWTPPCVEYDLSVLSVPRVRSFEEDQRLVDEHSSDPGFEVDQFHSDFWALSISAFCTPSLSRIVWMRNRSKADRVSNRSLNIWKFKIVSVRFTIISSITLLHSEETFTIPILQAITKCNLFQKDPTLLGSPYRIQSPVSLSIFLEFFSRHLKGIPFTHTNLTELHQLLWRVWFLWTFRVPFLNGLQRCGCTRTNCSAWRKLKINTPTSLRFCKTKSLNSPQILGVLSMKFQHFDLASAGIQTLS